MNALTAHGSGLPAWWGRFPLGVPFARSKGTKTRLGRSRRREPGIRALGTAAHQGKALGVEEHANIEVSAAHRTGKPSM